jgi:hypothetical protein
MGYMLGIQTARWSHKPTFLICDEYLPSKDREVRIHIQTHRPTHKHIDSKVITWAYCNFENRKSRLEIIGNYHNEEWEGLKCKLIRNCKIWALRLNENLANYETHTTSQEIIYKTNVMRCCYSFNIFSNTHRTACRIQQILSPLINDCKR